MKKLVAVIVCVFISILGFLYFAQKRYAPANRVNDLPFYKQIDSTKLRATNSLNTGAYTFRLYLYGDSLYLLSGEKDIIVIDTGLHGVRRQPFPFEPGKNSVWYFNKEGALYSYLTYPAGNIIQADKHRVDSFAQHMPLNNCVNTGSIFWALTANAADTALFISTFDMRHKTTQQKFDMHAVFSTVKDFSRDCFNASMDGSFFRVSDSLFIFYNYYSSYLVQFNNSGYAVYCGIDSIPLRRFRKLVTRSGAYTIEKCAPESEKMIHFSGCSDGRFVYMLSTVTRKELNLQLSVDVYHAQNMKYLRSFVVPDRGSSKPVDIITDATSNSLYILYGNNDLVKYAKP